MNDRYNIAQAEASAFYPAVTTEELDNEALLLANYRMALGRSRMLAAALGLGTLAWLVDYVRRGGKAK